MTAWPEEYKRRSLDIHEMEQTKKVFSPRLSESPTSFKSTRKSVDLAKNTTLGQWGGNTPASISPGKSNGRLEFTNAHNHSRLLEPRMEESCNDIREEANTVQGSVEAEDETSTSLSVSAEAFCCSACHKFLYRPVVLNCGDVFCESCLKTSDSSTFSCPSCGNGDPRGQIHVCLELHHYLEGTFPTNYLQRRKEIEQKAEQSDDRITDHSKTSDVEDEMEVDETECRFVHIGTGCDGCGMFPIVGHRYNCKDCCEQTGYDLCGSCYRSGGSGLICGRFNQQHKPDHSNMEEIFSEFRWANTPPMNFNLQNGLISRRRLQQVLDDFDDYIDSFV